MSFPEALSVNRLSSVDPFELAQLLLVESAHPQVSDRLTGPPLPFCHVRFFSLHHLVSHYQKCNLCETRFCHTSRVSQGYTLTIALKGTLMKKVLEENLDLICGIILCATAAVLAAVALLHTDVHVGRVFTVVALCATFTIYRAVLRFRN